MERIVEYQGYGISRKVTAALFAASAVFTASACSAEENRAEPTPSVSHSAEAKPTVEPTPTETTAKPETTATGTYEDFVAAVDAAPLDNIDGVMTVDDVALNCHQVLQYNSNLGFKLPNFDPASGPSFCSPGHYKTEARTLSAFFNKIEKFANNSDAFPEGTDPDIKAGLTMDVGVQLYAQYDLLQRGVGDVSDEYQVESLVTFFGPTYKWTNGLHTDGYKLTDDDIERVYHEARNDVYNIGQLPEAVEKAAADPAPEVEPEADAEPVQNTNLTFADELLDEATTATGDRTTAIPVFAGADAYTCDDLLGNRIEPGEWCNDTDLAIFAVVEDRYKDIAAESGVDQTEAAFIAFHALRHVHDGTIEYIKGSQQISDEIISMSGVDVGADAITAVGDALGLTQQYPGVFAQS